MCRLPRSSKSNRLLCRVIPRESPDRRPAAEFSGFGWRMEAGTNYWLPAWPEGIQPSSPCSLPLRTTRPRSTQYAPAPMDVSQWRARTELLKSTRETESSSRPSALSSRDRPVSSMRTCGCGPGPLWTPSKAPLAGLHIAFPELPDYAHVDLLGFADHRVGLIESSDGVLYLPNQQTGNWLRHPLTAPEFEAIRNLPARVNGELPFFMSPTVAGGEFYVLSNRTDLRQGAKILRFDPEGKLRARYLCPLPMSVVPHSAANRNGYLMPTSIVIMDRTLLLISWSQKVVASYSLN